ERAHEIEKVVPIQERGPARVPDRADSRGSRGDSESLLVCRARSSAWSPMLRDLIAFGPLVAVVLMDMQNLLAWSRRRVLELADAGCDDFTIIIPLYGNPSYFADRHRVAWLKQHILVAAAMDTPAMRDGADELEAEGWRVLRVETGDARPTAPRLMRAALESGRGTTIYAARLDADTVPTPGVERAVEAVRRGGAALVGLKGPILQPR